MNLRAFALLLPLLPVTLYACSSDPAVAKDGGTTQPGVDGSLPGENDGSIPVEPTDGATPPLGDGAVLPDGAADPNPLSGAVVAEHLGSAETMMMGVGYMDGLLWADGALFFTDPYADGGKGHIWRLPRVGAEPAQVPISNKAIGLCSDPVGGTIVITETTPPAITRRKADGTAREVVAANATNNATFNGANDCVVVQNKGIYVTDPDYIGQNQAKEAVYRLTGTPAVVTTVLEYDRAMAKHPNGIAVSPDGNTLYVSLTGASGPGAGEIVKVTLGADGAPVGPPATFATTGANPDGLATDTDGNVYVATAAGVEAYSTAGRKWGVLALPGTQKATSLAFGDPMGKTLFVGSVKDGAIGVGNGVIHKIVMRTAGIP